MSDVDTSDYRICSLCSNPAVEFRTILEERPPEYGKDGELWTSWQPFDLLYLCRDHSARFARYRISVKEQGRPEEDEHLGDGQYRTPAGWEYKVIDGFKGIGWIRKDG